MPPPAAHPWSKMPALRLLIPFMAGIVGQWYTPLPLWTLITGGIILVIATLLHQVLPLQKRYGLAPANGVVVSLLLAVIGAGAVYSHDVRNRPEWFGHHLPRSRAVVVRLEEPLVEKPASWKAEATVLWVYTEADRVAVQGKLLLYFKKDSLPPPLAYGSQLVVRKGPQRIRNTGNPGAFDYQRYSLFEGITHQVYLAPGDYFRLRGADARPLRKFLFRSRQAIIGVLQTYIGGAKEQGLAEALLIGYKDDLDKALLRSYSNTGVVHVIAISGLHVGLIYWLLLGLSRPLKRTGLLTLRLLLLLAGLWGFGLLAGAGASVLRSVVMFSFLAGAEVLARRTSVYNTLALSAFLLLCYHPFWLWDVGFQLSYAAVGSILLFYKPLAGLIIFPNKAMDALWKLNAVTLSAQVLTTPLVLYHFHQFPNLFLLTNLLAVPLSSVILLGEIGLCALAFLPQVAAPAGNMLRHLIGYMNAYIEGMDAVSFAVWGGISINGAQTALLAAGITALVWGLVERRKAALYPAAVCAALFLTVRAYSFWKAESQHKLIVYNVPRHQAIDVIEGRTCRYLGDAAVQQDPLMHNYHLQPSRVLHRLAPVAEHSRLSSFRWNGWQVVVIDSAIQLKKDAAQTAVDLLILSGKANVQLPALAGHFRLRQVVADASVPRWKARLWKRACDSLHLPFYDVAEKGAFVLSR